ncbi:hypothetical protein FKP32DRAFT_602432 [Trametes sanguinea]|nr:hypothetical protein FKP32DRAFT_602432 [Trametes sanguinea]
MPRYANSVNDAAHFGRTRRLFHVVSNGLHTLAIHGYAIGSSYRPAQHNTRTTSDLLFPTVTHLQLGSYAIAPWVAHAPHSTHLLAPGLHSWDYSKFLDNAIDVLGFSPADFSPSGESNTRPAITHPHTWKFASEMPPAPFLHDGCGTGRNFYLEL